LLLFRDELCSFCPEVLISTNDGSCGRQGFVTDLLVERLTEDKTVAEVVAIGPVPMMRAVAEATKPFGVKTTVSLNSIMVDGIGMCGACRVGVGGETKFACVDGPEFDGHLVDFAGLSARLTSFKEQERVSYEELKKSHVCQCSK
jgi:ferredoxin--NADP+ reductase